MPEELARVRTVVGAFAALAGGASIASRGLHVALLADVLTGVGVIALAGVLALSIAEWRRGREPRARRADARSRVRRLAVVGAAVALVGIGAGSALLASSGPTAGKLRVASEVRLRSARSVPWEDGATATSRQRVQARLRVQNIGDMPVHDAVLRQSLPPGVEVVPGSVRLTPPAGAAYRVPDAPLFDDGFSMRSIAPHATVTLRFDLKLATSAKPCTARGTMSSFATGGGETISGSNYLTSYNCSAGSGFYPGRHAFAYANCTQERCGPTRPVFNSWVGTPSCQRS